jgi:hypothetical protein
MDRHELTYIVIIVMIFILLFGIFYGVIQEVLSRRNSPIKICSVGWAGRCIHTKNVRYENGCAIADNGERVCGNYFIKK